MRARVLLLVWAGLALVAGDVGAEPRCTRETSAGQRFATCFDQGNRLRIDASTSGYGWAIELRHVLRFDDEPDLVWKAEHRILDAHVDFLSDRSDAVLYQGRFIRHARDGHILLPFGTGRKLFLPFDVGAEVEVGSISGELLAEQLDVGVIRGAVLFDVARSETFRRRLAIGIATHWNMGLDRTSRAIVHQRVAPFSLATVSAYSESANGITRASLRVDAGGSWFSPRGWERYLAASAKAERIILAINGRPLSLVASVAHHPNGETRARVGVAFAPLFKRHARVNLKPLAAPK